MSSRAACPECGHTDREAEPLAKRVGRWLGLPRRGNNIDPKFLRSIDAAVDRHGPEAYELITRLMAEAEERSQSPGRWRIRDKVAWFMGAVRKRLTERFEPRDGDSQDPFDRHAAVATEPRQRNNR